MKKSILTLSLVALFSAANAQDTKPKVKEGARTEAATPVVTKEKTEGEATKQEEPVKKSGTRMAINEKGLPGNAKTAKKEPAKEEKAPAVGQPGTSTKKEK